MHEFTFFENLEAIYSSYNKEPNFVNLVLLFFLFIFNVDVIATDITQYTTYEVT